METTTTTAAERQLHDIAKSIETYRADLGLTKSALLNAYPELGTDKTYGKIIAGDFRELKVEDKWLPAYQDVWSRIQTDDIPDNSELIADLDGPASLCRAYLETRNTRGNDRFILLLGDSGVGKSCAVAVLKGKPYGSLIHTVEACEVWKNRYGKGTAAPLLREIARSLGVKDLPSGRDKLKDLVVDQLNSKRRCIVVEEAHHLCPEGVNILKTLINLTPVIIIATAMPVLWDKLSGSRAAWAECKQLTGNRLSERIVLTLQLGDVRRVIAQQLDDLQLTSEMLEKAAARVAVDAPHFGNMKFVTKCVKRFRREVRAGESPTAETFATAIAQEKKRR